MLKMNLFLKNSLVVLGFFLSVKWKNSLQKLFDQIPQALSFPKLSLIIRIWLKSWLWQQIQIFISKWRPSIFRLGDFLNLKKKFPFCCYGHEFNTILVVRDSLETSKPEEKGQHKFDGIFLCSMGLNGAPKVQSFEILSYLGSFGHFFP